MRKNCTKKDLYDPDNHDDVITNLEPDILESEVKWALESITSSVLSFLYGPALTSIHDYWENYSFDQMDICQRSNISAF